MSAEYYQVDKSKTNGFRSSCKLCAKKDREVNKERIKLANKRWRDENKEYSRNYQDKWILENKEYCKNYNKNYRKTYKISNESLILQRETRNKRRKERYKTDINYKLNCLLRARLKDALKHHQKKGSAVKDLGCSILELRKHLEKQFQPGMTWENHRTIRMAYRSHYSAS